MPVTPTIQNTKPVVGGSADVWGGIINDRIGETYTDINALAALANANETVAGAAVPKAGGAMTGDLVLAASGPGDALSAGYRGAPVVNFSTDKTLALSDAGKVQRLTGSTARTLTIPPASSVGFPIGTVIPLRNAATASLNIARGSGVTLRIPGSATNADRVMTSYGTATLLLEDANVWLITGVGVS